MTSSLPDELRPLVNEVCAELRLHRFAAITVERWVLEGPDAWETCCGGGCDPCNGVLKAAAKRVLKRLEDAEASAPED